MLLGLTIDNLRGVDMVLADGSFVTASSNDHADLFWAVRGGGGNFGVVTSFLFHLHPISAVYGGPMLWPFEQAADVMKFWRNFILNAPEDINGWFAFLTVPPAPPFPEQFHLQKMCAIVWCYSGALERADEAFQPIRTSIPAAVDFAGPIPWPVLQSLFDALYPKGLQWYWKTDFFNDLSGRAIELHLKYGAQLPTVHSTMHLYPINGAVHRVGASETSFSFREANFAEVIVGVDPDPANNERMIGWARDYWMALHPYSAGGGYVNMMMDEGEDNVQAAYHDNYVRLAQTKARYDPGNLFHVNQNIKPKGELMDATEARNIQVVRTYYDGCNSGDIDLLMSTFAPEVTHYFLPASFPPITGAEALAQYWRWWKENLDPVWAHDHVIARGDEVVSEWSCIFTPPGTSKRLINRGTEWYVMRDSRIVEVRAYFIASSESSIQLATFPYGDRSYLPAPT